MISTKLWKIIGLVAIIILAVIAFYRFAAKNTKNAETVKVQEKTIIEQKQEIEKVHEVIETKKNQQKIINKTSDIINIDSRREWMRLIFQERNATNSKAN